MAIRPNFMADLAQMANGAASAFGGMREEIDNLIRQRMERTLNARGLLTREEFDALRTRHEAVAARLGVLEAIVATLPANTSESINESQVKSAKLRKPAAKRKKSVPKSAK